MHWCLGDGSKGLLVDQQRKQTPGAMEAHRRNGGDQQPQSGSPSAPPARMSVATCGASGSPSQDVQHCAQTPAGNTDELIEQTGDQDPPPERRDPPCDDPGCAAPCVDRRLEVRPGWKYLDNLSTLAAAPLPDVRAFCCDVLTNSIGRVVDYPGVAQVVVAQLPKMGLGELRECVSSADRFAETIQNVRTDAGLTGTLGPLQWHRPPLPHPRSPASQLDGKRDGQTLTTPSTAAPASASGASRPTVGSTTVPVPRGDTIDPRIRVPSSLPRYSSRDEMALAPEDAQREFIGDAVTFLVPGFLPDPNLAQAVTSRLRVLNLSQAFDLLAEIDHLKGQVCDVLLQLGSVDNLQRPD